MPSDRSAVDLAIHATAVAIGDRALLIQGPSRAGKSRLASALMARSSRERPIVLVGDDRVLLHADHRGVVARPHPRIAGFIERRGLGLCAAAHRERAHVAALVHLGVPVATYRLLENFPVLTLVMDTIPDDGCEDVLAWFGRMFNDLDGAARRPQVGAKARDGATSLAKD